MECCRQSASNAGRVSTSARTVLDDDARVLGGAGGDVREGPGGLELQRRLGVAAQELHELRNDARLDDLRGEATQRGRPSTVEGDDRCKEGGEAAAEREEGAGRSGAAARSVIGWPILAGAPLSCSSLPLPLIEIFCEQTAPANAGIKRAGSLTIDARAY